MVKVGAWLWVFALVMSATFVGYSLVAGVNVPYPDPTPRQAAWERFHLPILAALFLLAGVGWLAAGSVSVAILVVRAVRGDLRRETRREIVAVGTSPDDNPYAAPQDEDVRAEEVA